MWFFKIKIEGKMLISDEEFSPMSSNKVDSVEGSWRPGGGLSLPSKWYLTLRKVCTTEIVEAYSSDNEENPSGIVLISYSLTSYSFWDCVNELLISVWPRYSSRDCGSRSGEKDCYATGVCVWNLETLMHNESKRPTVNLHSKITMFVL